MKNSEEDKRPNENEGSLAGGDLKPKTIHIFFIVAFFAIWTILDAVFKHFN